MQDMDQKKLEIKEIEYNQYSSTVGLCKILGVQDFKEFNNYLKTKGKELNILGTALWRCRRIPKGYRIKSCEQQVSELYKRIGCYQR